MEAKLKFGIDKLLFGMKQDNVESIYGKPDFKYFDEDENIILGYNSLQSRLTFYADEDFKSAKSKVLNANLSEGIHTIEMVVTWSNKWVPKFEVKGVLTVNIDGSNARFEITEKNMDAESLEISSGNFDTVLELEQI